MILGQDECIFYQYMLSLKGWIGPNGERSLDPKTVGEGLMISAFKSRDLGFGHPPFTEEEIIRINLYRQDKSYVDSEAAKELLGSDQKNDCPLKVGDNPFIRHLLIGKYNDGYWTSAHMALQFENVVDCCVALYGDVYDFMYLFDHSCGHDRKPAGALDAKALNVGYGGSQAIMEPSLINGFNGYLGQHPRLVDPGDTQHFSFQEEDEGPYYLSDTERQQKKYDTPTGRLLSKNKTKKQLATELVSLGLVDVMQLPTTLAELKAKATEHDIDLKIETQLIVEGWNGKPKGLNQICWERGLLDPTQTYTKANLTKLLHDCTDFQNSETNLQMIGRRLGVKVERTPKFHCEMAGEGIEYDWALCKAKYRCRPLEQKRGRTTFQDLVKELTAWHSLTMSQTRRTGARARSYISAYYNIHYNNNSLSKEKQEGLTHDEAIVVENEEAAIVAALLEAPWQPDPGKVICMDLIEKTKKVYHSHRGVNSFEKGMYHMV